jgi:hypothetical protein
MAVIDAAGRQLSGERVALELRVAPRARRADAVHHPLDAVARQEADEPSSECVECPTLKARIPLGCRDTELSPRTDVAP